MKKTQKELEEQIRQAPLRALVNAGQAQPGQAPTLQYSFKPEIEEPETKKAKIVKAIKDKNESYLKNELQGVTGLDLNHSELEVYNMAFFLTLNLNNNNLKKIDVGINYIKSGGARCISIIAKDNPNLEVFILNCNQLGNEGIIAISGIVPSFRALKMLNLSCNRIDVNGTKILANALTTNSLPSLEEFNFGANNIGNEGVRFLAEALKHLKNLKKLNISDCGLVGQGMGDLADILINGLTLTELNISHNSLGLDGAESFSKAFIKSSSHKSTLKSFNIAWSSLGPDGAKSFAEAFQHFTLTQLNIEWNEIPGNPFEHRGIDAIIEGLKQNHTLVNLGYSNQFICGRRKIEEQFSKQIEEYLTRNRKLAFEEPVEHAEAMLIQMILDANAQLNAKPELTGENLEYNSDSL